MRNKCSGIIAGILLILLDQFTKYLASFFLRGNSDLVLIPGVLQLHYLENQSAAFSIDPVSVFQSLFHLSYFTEHPQAFLQAKMLFLILLTLTVTIFLFLLYLKIPAEPHYFPLGLILIFFIAGGIGNMIDRVFRGYVVDFIYFSLIDFPVFNTADIYVTGSGLFLIVFLLFYYTEDDMKRIHL